MYNFTQEVHGDSKPGEVLSDITMITIFNRQTELKTAIELGKHCSCMSVLLYLNYCMFIALAYTQITCFKNVDIFDKELVEMHVVWGFAIPSLFSSKHPTSI